MIPGVGDCETGGRGTCTSKVEHAGVTRTNALIHTYLNAYIQCLSSVCICSSLTRKLNQGDTRIMGKPILFGTVHVGR